MIPKEEQEAAAARAKQHRAAAKARIMLEFAQTNNLYVKPVSCHGPSELNGCYNLYDDRQMPIARDILSRDLAEAIVAFLNT